jgi:aryl-alcohol dehydrogenase-like predicted oxidoreductase
LPENTMSAPSREQELSRRSFLAAAAAVTAGAAPAAAPSRAEAPEAPAEWRNRKESMAYRRLGRTGMMVSEVVCGGDPIKLDNYKHLELALEKGLNYLDMAPAYNKGDTERAYGKLLAASPGRLRQVFLATKVSGFTQLRNQMYLDLLEGLPGEKQRAIRARALALRRERGVEKPGYHLTYFPGQQRTYEAPYIRIAMTAGYSHKVEGSPKFRRFIAQSLEGSLKRLGTEYVDVLLCPHGADAPEDLEAPEILAVFRQLKKQGKVRFLGVSSHNDPAGILRRATELGHYDMVMMAYNVINGGYLEEPIRQAARKGVGMIAMKVAHAVATHHKSLQPIPAWRVQKVERIVPGKMKAPLKAYLWALQNPHIAAVISNLWDETYVKENLGLAGKKVALRPA